MLRKAMQRGKADVADTRPLFSTLSYCLNSVSHTAGGYGDGCAGFYRFCAAALETGKIGKKQKWRKAQKAQNLSTWLLRFLYVFFASFREEIFASCATGADARNASAKAGRDSYLVKALFRLNELAAAFVTDFGCHPGY